MMVVGLPYIEPGARLRPPAHARIVSMLFDGFVAPRDGAIHPDASRPGLGIELKSRDAKKFRIL